MNTTAARILLCCAALAAAPAFAQKTCSKAEAANVEKALDRVNSWPGLYKAYNDYRHCDRDNTADVFTDAILRLMVDWKNIDALAASVAKDPAYKTWMENHLLSPAAKDDLASVHSRAKTMCPASQAAYCADLASVTKSPGSGTAPAAAASPDNVLDFTPLKPINKP
jgi:hypothetical protein